MSVVYQTLLTILFPRTHYEQWLDNISADFVIKYCPPGSLNGLPLGIRPLFTYKDSHISAIVQQMKFFKHAPSLKLIASLMSAEMINEYHASTNPPHIILTSIPVRRRRLRQYGYCQGKLLAKYMCATIESVGFTCSYVQFLRRRPVLFDREQKLLSRKKRLGRTNPFIWRRKNTPLAKNRPIHIWIIDDVVTTGFTLDMAREMLYLNMPIDVPITIRCLAFAH